MAKILLLSCTQNKPADKFTSVVGKLMVNCGLLETLSVSWLTELGENRLSVEEINFFKKKTFKSRKDKLLGLVRTQISDREFQKNLKNTWTKTEDVMNFRNSIAHASLVEVRGKKKVFYDQKNNRKVTLQEINPVIDQCSKIIEGMLKKAASGVLALLPCSRTGSTLRASKRLRPCWTIFFEHSLQLMRSAVPCPPRDHGHELFNSPIDEINSLWVKLPHFKN